MTCSSFGATSEVSLYYTKDTDSTSLWSDSVTWEPVPFTAESLATTITSTGSEQISDTYSGTVTTQGEVGGSISFEVHAGNFFFDMLLAVLQSNKKTSVGTGVASIWYDAATIKNGTTKHCFAFLKRISVGGYYDWFIYRGVQVSAMSLDVSPGTLVTGSVDLAGVSSEAPRSALAKPAGWTLTPPADAYVMSSSDSLQEFDIKDNGVSVGLTLESLSIRFDNQLRQQPAVGISSIYPVGVASGRFMATYSGMAYYANSKLYSALINSTNLTIGGKLVDLSAEGIEFSSAVVRVSSGSTPMAEGPDQDLMVNSEFQAFDHATGTVAVIKNPWDVLDGLPTELVTEDGIYLTTEDGKYVAAAGS
jgi:hypothetical protein